LRLHVKRKKYCEAGGKFSFHVAKIRFFFEMTPQNKISPIVDCLKTNLIIGNYIRFYTSPAGT